MFHVSQLKNALGRSHEMQSSPPTLSDMYEWIAIPQEVFAYQKNAVTGVWEALISWHGTAADEATWEELDDFRCQFPEFHLEDKVN